MLNSKIMAYYLSVLRVKQNLFYLGNLTVPTYQGLLPCVRKSEGDAKCQKKMVQKGMCVYSSTQSIFLVG